MAGLIPAYAGRTAHSHQCGPGIRAHPRLRGADCLPSPAHAALSGSSPLTRGGLVTVTSEAGTYGLIPAYAGRTVTRVTPPRGPTAHPRLRGADFKPENEEEWHEGSSPLTRGGLHLLCGSELGLRLIPAYAGRTICAHMMLCVIWAHPRLRGADAQQEIEIVLREGSSPLTRGGRNCVRSISR